MAARCIQKCYPMAASLSISGPGQQSTRAAAAEFGIQESVLLAYVRSLPVPGEAHYADEGRAR